MKILLLNIYKLSMFSVSPCRQLNSKPVYFVWPGTHGLHCTAAGCPAPSLWRLGGRVARGGSPVLSPGAGIVRGAAAGNIFYIKSRQVGQTLLCKPTVNINSFPDLLSHFLSHSLYKYCFTTFPFLSNTAVRSIFAVYISFDDNAELLNVLQSIYNLKRLLLSTKDNGNGLVVYII